jgi:hypothetical protein
MREPSDENGFRGDRPRLPTGLVAVSVAVALLAVSGLLYLLYQETRGPGEILREFAQAVDERDCGTSYDLLDASVQADLTEESWCAEGAAAADEAIDADFTLERAVLEGDRARVEVSGSAAATEWILGRYGDRSWRVIGPTGGF